MTSAFTTEQYLQGANSGRFVRPENEETRRQKPRASALIGCARAQMYDYTATPRTNTPSPDAVITQELGRMAEEYTREVIPHIPSPLVETGWDSLTMRSGWRTPQGQRTGQDALPDDYFLTGHPDADLHQRRFVATEEGRRNEWKETLADGLRWGLEHKFYGAYSYEKTALTDDPVVAIPGLVAQGVLYGDALGWNRAVAVVLAQDASLIRGKITQARKYATEGKAPETRERNRRLLEQWAAVNPKVHVFTINIDDLKLEYLPSLRTRADAITTLLAEEVNPDEVRRERNPDSHPLCGYCPWKDRCVSVGRAATIEVPESTLKES